MCTGQLACLNVKMRSSVSVHFCFDHDFATSLLPWEKLCELLQVRGFQPLFSEPNCFCLLLLNNSKEVSVCKASPSHLKQRGFAFILHPDSVVHVEIWVFKLQAPAFTVASSRKSFFFLNSKENFCAWKPSGVNLPRPLPISQASSMHRTGSSWSVASTHEDLSAHSHNCKSD